MATTISPSTLARHRKLTVAKYYAIAGKTTVIPSARNLSSIDKGTQIVRRTRLHHDAAEPSARLWYYYNQLFEVKTLLTFSTG